jgi:oxygen-dependent protoporphyrinogen oxidase
MPLPLSTPNSSLTTSPIAVIGGGISGLAAAFRLSELAPNQPVTVYEASSRLGGVLRTEREQGYLLEGSADSFITNPSEALELCRRLGLEDQLLPTNAELRGAEIVRNGKLFRVPEGFMLMAPHDAWQVWRSPILSWPGKLRLLSECLLRRRSSDLADESLKSFVTRRLGREAFERLVQPLVGGIYTADAEKLSMAAALPRFWKMEQQFGGLMRAVWKTRKRATNGEAGSGARYSLFVTLRDGMGQLVNSLASRIGEENLQRNTPVQSIDRSETGWRLHFPDGSTTEHAAVIVAVSAYQAAAMLRGLDASLADELNGIPYAGAVLALAGYRLEQIARPPRSFGFVVPAAERRDILAASFSSLKFPGRAPEGRLLIRVFLGGAMRPDQLALDDAAVSTIVRRELGELIGATGEPELFQVHRWERAMPQYHVGHLDRIERIAEHLQNHPSLALAGNAYTGVGIPQSVASGTTAAEKVLAHSPTRSVAPPLPSREGAGGG